VFETGRTHLKPGDCVFLFTDGVTEATDADGNFFSDQQLRSLLDPLVGSSTEEIVSTVLRKVRSYSSGILPADDITELALRYRGELALSSLDSASGFAEGV
jgi:sigma-B regulation protein RsbU (phosphoserine phosphatase)